MIDIGRYFSRIGYVGSTQLSYKTLCELQAHHLYHIPFENFAIHDDYPIRLDVASLFTKIVQQGRGGFCYELNGLFFVLLEQLGFEAKLVAARVYGQTGYGQPFDHMAIVVTFENISYLLDVGFGEFTLHPLMIADGIQKDKRGDFIIKQVDDQYIVYQSTQSGEQPKYQFDLVARQVADFSEMCHYHQTSEQSHFTQKRLISLATQNGRITLSGNCLIIRDNDHIEEADLSPDDYKKALTRYFSPFPLK